MDTILLVIGVVGLSISGWVLRGYFLSTPTDSNPPKESFSIADRNEPNAEKPVSYVSAEDHQLVLNRLAELEKGGGGYAPKIDENGSLTHNNLKTPPAEITQANMSAETSTDKELVAGEGEGVNSEKWKEIFALQEAYKSEREREQDIDYEREQALFDTSAGFDGHQLGANSEEDETDQRLLDNQFEGGEELEEYQQRMAKFASLTKEMLVMRLEAADAQLRDQQEKHLATLLSIIASLIEKMPADVNLKSVAQSSFIAASTEISNEEGEMNRENFQQMFFKNFGH